jgi:hypothetical protein
MTMAIRSRLLSLAAAFCAVLAIAMPAFADIKAYNAAVLRGDFLAASNEAEAIWPSFDKTRPDIFVIGREFAWTGMLAKKPKLARDIVLSLSRSTVVDSTPALTSTLLAWASFSIEPNNETRKALSSALAERARTTSADLISIRASQELFTYEWSRDNFDDSAKAAALGAEFAKQFGGEMVDVQFGMRRNELISKFVRKPQRSDLTAISELATEIDNRITPEIDAKMRSSLIAQLATTIAWRGVQRNVLQFGAINPTGVGGTENESDARRLREKWFPVPGDPRKPVCDLSLDMGGVRPTYPRQALTKRLPGYAIYAFDVGESGKFKSARILGSAPHDMFTETIDEILPAWKWKLSEGNLSADCRMPQILVVDFLFQMKRR